MCNFFSFPFDCACDYRFNTNKAECERLTEKIEKAGRSSNADNKIIK